MMESVCQVTNFEFSNESFNQAYNGQATALQYASALADWVPKLRAILPTMRIGANGQPGWDYVGKQDKTNGNAGWHWWGSVRARAHPPQPARSPSDAG